jgi:hypothetical protein
VAESRAPQRRAIWPFRYRTIPSPRSRGRDRWERHPPGRAAIAKSRGYAEAAGRDPASIGIDTRVTAGIGAEAEWRETVRFWKSCGVSHLTLGTYSGQGHPRRIAGRSLPDHLEAIRRYWNAVADLL